MNHTANPATPHPDQGDQDAPTLEEAIAIAYAMLMHKGTEPAITHARQRAAFDLIDAYTAHKETAQ